MVKTVIVRLGTKKITKIIEASRSCNKEDLIASEKNQCWELVPESKNTNHKCKSVRLEFTKNSVSKVFRDWDVTNIMKSETINGWKFSGIIRESNICKIKYKKAD